MALGSTLVRLAYQSIGRLASRCISSVCDAYRRSAPQQRVRRAQFQVFQAGGQWESPDGERNATTGVDEISELGEKKGIQVSLNGPNRPLFSSTFF